MNSIHPLSRHGNVYYPAFRKPAALAAVSEGSDFDRLTAALLLDRHRRGELDEGVLVALMAGVGLELPR